MDKNLLEWGQKILIPYVQELKKSLFKVQLIILAAWMNECIFFTSCIFDHIRSLQLLHTI